MFNVKCGEVKIQQIQANVHDMLWHDDIDPVLSHLSVQTRVASKILEEPSVKSLL